MAKNKFQKMMSSISEALSKFFNLVKFEKIIDKSTSDATIKRINNMKRVAIMIGLLILVIIIVILLLHGCQGGEAPHGSIHIPGNIIDPTPPENAMSIELTAKDGYENIPFDVNNMLPGDSAAQYYCVSVTHDSTENVRFYINIDTAQKLSNVLRVKIEHLIPNVKDKVLYDGLMKDCTAVDVSVAASAQTATPIYYRITVYTNGAEVGNEYVGESLTADFSWQLQ